MGRILLNSVVFATTAFCLSGGYIALAQQPGGMQPQQAPSQPNPASNPGINPNANSPGYGATPTMPTKFDDKKFVKDQAVSAMSEIQLGKLASEKGSSPEVKEFGQKMVDDYTKSDGQLKQLASAANVNIPDALSSKEQSRINKISKLSGPAFDKAYLKDEVKNHQHDVREAQDETQGGTDANVKQFASNTLPTLQSQLSAAKELSKKSSGK